MARVVQGGARWSIEIVGSSSEFAVIWVSVGGRGLNAAGLNAMAAAIASYLTVGAAGALLGARQPAGPSFGFSTAGGAWACLNSADAEAVALSVQAVLNAGANNQ